MDQEELIRQIMAEVMKDLGKQQVSFARKQPATSSSSNSGAGLTVANYPLAEKHPEKVKSASGRSLDEITFEGLTAGSLDDTDFRITQETLEMQAQVAESAGRPQLADNLRRAAELVPIPDQRILEIYESLRPYRSTKQELYDIASELESQYGAKVSADWVREAADVYERRNRLRKY